MLRGRFSSIGVCFGIHGNIDDALSIDFEIASCGRRRVLVLAPQLNF